MINIVASRRHLSVLIRGLYFSKHHRRNETLTHFLEIKFTKTSCEKILGYYCKYTVSFFLYISKLVLSVLYHLKMLQPSQEKTYGKKFEIL